MLMLTKRLRGLCRGCVTKEERLWLLADHNGSNTWYRMNIISSLYLINGRTDYGLISIPAIAYLQSFIVLFPH